MKSQMRELYAFFFCFPCFMVVQDRSWRRDGIKVDIAHEYLTTLGVNCCTKKSHCSLAAKIPKAKVKQNFHLYCKTPAISIYHEEFALHEPASEIQHAESCLQ